MNLATLHQQRCPVQSKKATAPLVSVIIPAHNEQDYLQATLESVYQQPYRAYEVVVVANGCTDRTVAVARDFCDQLLIVQEKGLSRARNLGADAARGEILMFLDADTLLEWNALETITDKFTRQYAAGTLKGKPDSKRWIYHFIYFLKNFQHRWSLHQGSSGVILCWRDHFRAMGGFDESLEVMENSDLINKLKSLGEYLYIEDTVVTTSMRRFEKYGVLRACKLWIKLWVHSLFDDVRHRKYEIVR